MNFSNNPNELLCQLELATYLDPDATPPLTMRNLSPTEVYALAPYALARLFVLLQKTGRLQLLPAMLSNALPADVKTQIALMDALWTQAKHSFSSIHPLSGWLGGLTTSQLWRSIEIFYQVRPFIASSSLGNTPFTAYLFLLLHKVSPFAISHYEIFSDPHPTCLSTFPVCCLTATGPTYAEAEDRLRAIISEHPFFKTCPLPRERTVRSFME